MAGVAVFTSVLMITLLLQPLKGSFAFLRNRYQLCRLADRRLLYFDGFRLFFHLRDLDVLQYLLDALVHFAERLANGAAVALATLAAHRHARRDEQRSIDGLDHFEGGNRSRVARQRVSTLDAMLRREQARLG